MLAKAISGGLLVTAVGAGLVLVSSYQVPGGHRAVVFSKLTGVKKKTYGEGLNIRIPFVETRYIIPVRTRSSTLSTTTGSRDLQDVTLGIRILFRPDTANLPDLFQKIGLNYEEKILPSIGNEVLKSVVAQYNASQLITLRQNISLLVKNQLTEKAKKFFIVVDDVAITDLSFSKEYSSAVEAKQIAQQEAQRAAILVEQARQERQRKMVQAEGEAQAATMLGKAIQKNSGYLELRKIRAAQNIAKTISTGKNTAFLDSDSLMINLSPFSPKTSLSE